MMKMIAVSLPNPVSADLSSGWKHGRSEQRAEDDMAEDGFQSQRMTRISVVIMS